MTRANIISKRGAVGRLVGAWLVLEIRWNRYTLEHRDYLFVIARARACASSHWAAVCVCGYFWILVVWARASRSARSGQSSGQRRAAERRQEQKRPFSERVGEWALLLSGDARWLARSPAGRCCERADQLRGYVREQQTCSLISSPKSK